MAYALHNHIMLYEVREMQEMAPLMLSCPPNMRHFRFAMRPPGCMTGRQRESHPPRRSRLIEARSIW